MRTSFFAEMYRRLGEGLGLLDVAHESETAGKQVKGEPEIKRSLAAARRLRARARALKLGSISDEEILGWIRQGRR